MNNDSIETTLSDIRFDVSVVDVTVDNIDEAIVIANALESHEGMPTGISIAPFQVPVLDAASVAVLLQAIFAKKKSLVRLKLHNCTIDDSTGLLALVLENTIAFYYTNDGVGANANVLELAKSLKRLDKTAPALIIDTNANNLDVLIDAIPQNVFRIQLNGEMELNDVVIDSLVRLIPRVGENFNEISARRCKITGSILPLIAAIQNSNISILGFRMPDNQDPKVVYRMLELCKSIRELTIENRPVSDFNELDWVLPRLISYNSISRGPAIRQYGTVSISGSKPIRSNIMPAITNTLDNVNNINHITVILHFMTAEELRTAFSSKKIMHNTVKHVEIYDSDVSSIETVFPSSSHRVFKNALYLTIKNSELKSDELGRLSDIFPNIFKLDISDNPGITTLSSLRFKKLGRLDVTYCNLTSIDFEEMKTIDVSGNLTMTDAPYKFALDHPDSIIRARNCGFSLVSPYIHIKIYDDNTTKYIRLDYFHKMLDEMALEVGLGASTGDSFMIYDN